MKTSIGAHVGAHASCARLVSILLAFLFLVASAQAQTPTPSPSPAAVAVDQETFGAALKSFHRLLNAIDIGVSLVDYKRELLDAKTDFDIVVAKLPDSTQRDKFQEAMRDYMIAADVWEVGIQGTTVQVPYSTYPGPYLTRPVYYSGIVSKTDFYRSLRARYGEKLLPPPKAGNSLGRGIVRYEGILKIVWARAALRIALAIEIQRAALDFKAK